MYMSYVEFIIRILHGTLMVFFKGNLLSQDNKVLFDISLPQRTTTDWKLFLLLLSRFKKKMYFIDYNTLTTEQLGRATSKNTYISTARSLYKWRHKHQSFVLRAEFRRSQTETHGQPIPTAREPTEGECTSTVEVDVTRLPHHDNDFYRRYFENSQNGGGDVTEIIARSDGVLLVTFADTEGTDYHTLAYLS